MPDQPFTAYDNRFTAAGIDVSQPPDGGDQSASTKLTGAAPRYPILTNVRQISRGDIQSRPALNAVSVAPGSASPWHSVRRLSDRPTSHSCLVCGIGTALYSTPSVAYGSAPGNPVSRDTGWSGKPLCLLPFRPDQDIAEWLAVADEAKMRKIRLDGTVHRLGLPPPTYVPVPELNWLAGPNRLDVETGEGADAWSGGPLTAVRYSSNLNNYVYNGNDPTGGLSGAWFSLNVASAAQIGPGTIVYDALGRACFVEEVHPPSPAGVACTVTQILYDTGASGWATVYPSTSFREFQPHAIVQFTGGYGTSLSGIVDLFTGADGTVSFRCYIVAGPVVATNTISVLPTLYAYCALPPVTGSPLTSQAIRRAVPGGATTTYTKTGLALNLSAYASGRSVNRTEDEMHVSFRIDVPTNVDKIKIQLDVDDGTFTKNYYEREIRQADVLPLQLGTETAIDTRATTTRRTLLDNAGRHPGGVGNLRQSRVLDPLADPVSITPFGDRDVFNYSPPDDSVGSSPAIDPSGSSGSQASTGVNQWTEVRFKLADLQRYGTDESKSLQNVVALQFIITTNTGGGTSFYWDSWWLGGGYEPDVADGAPYEYRFRYRSSVTGARSNWSPGSRSGVSPHRYSVDVLLLGTTLAEADKIDIQRRGGAVNDWVVIATVPNPGAATTITFVDTYSDNYALGASADPLALEGNTNDQPFPISDASFTVLASVVAGTMIRHGASGFNTSWAQGVGVVANGIATSIRRVVSTDLMEVYDSVGAGTNVRVDIAEPILLAQPLPAIFGPVDGWYFGCGDPKNPGRLYVFNKNTLDSTQQSYYIDITDPGDPLQHGCVYQGRGYLWSTNAMFVLAIDESLPAAPVRFDKIDTGRGLFSRYALCVGDAMYWLARDGIYSSSGGDAQNITTGTLAPLFPTRGVAGADTYGVSAPALTAANVPLFALSYTYDHILWFDYVDGSNTRNSLGLMRASGGEESYGWWYDSYARGFGGPRFHYSDELEGYAQILLGGISAPAKLYAFGPSANGDDGNPINCQVRTFAYDADYPRATKLFGDVVIDIDPSTAAVTPTLYFDNWNNSYIAPDISGSGRAQTIIDINAGSGQYALNLAIDLQWNVVTTEAPILYRWGGGVLSRPDDTIQRATDYTDCGFWGPKEFRGCDVECDTQGQTKSVVFEYTKDDGSVDSVEIDITTPEKTIIPVAFPSTFVGYEIRLRPSDANTWKQYAVVQWHFDQLADLTPLITGWEDLGGLRYVQGIELFADTDGATVSLTVQRDFAAPATTFSVTHPGRGWKSYSFAAPFLAYLLRIVPTGAVRLMKWRWKSQAEAPLGDVWETQEAEIGTPFGVAQSAEIEYASTSVITLKYYVDDQLVLTDATTLVATGAIDPGTWRRVRVVLPAAKGRLAKLRLESSAQFRIREKGSTLYAKPYGVGRFTPLPFIGAQHRETGAEI